MARVFLRSFFATTLLLMSGIVALNYCYNPYRVFASFAPRTVSFEPNSRVLKANFIDRHSSEYDSYVFGDSRSAAILTSTLDAKYGGKFFNFSCSEENIGEVADMLDWLVAKKAPVRMVVISIGIDDLGKPRDPYLTQDLLRTPSWKISGSVVQFYQRFLLTQEITALSWANFCKPLDGGYRITYDADGSALYRWNLSSQRELDSFRLRDLPEADYEYQVAEHQKIAALAKRNHIKVLLVVAPLPFHREYDYMALAPSIKFLDRLTRIYGSSPLILKLNVPSGDYRLWHDLVHPKADLLNRLFDGALWFDDKCYDRAAKSADTAISFRSQWATNTL